MPRKPGPAVQRDYKPSDAAKEALAAWKKSVEEEERLRNAARAAIADDLKDDLDLPFSAVAKHDSIPWTEQTLRNIGWEYGVPPRQPNKAKPSSDV